MKIWVDVLYPYVSPKENEIEELVALKPNRSRRPEYRRGGLCGKLIADPLMADVGREGGSWGPETLPKEKADAARLNY